MQVRTSEPGTFLYVETMRTRRINEWTMAFIGKEKYNGSKKKVQAERQDGDVQYL